MIELSSPLTTDYDYVPLAYDFSNVNSLYVEIQAASHAYLLLTSQQFASSARGGTTFGSTYQSVTLCGVGFGANSNNLNFITSSDGSHVSSYGGQWLMDGQWRSFWISWTDTQVCILNDKKMIMSWPTKAIHIIASLWRGSTGHRWIPLTKGQFCGKHAHAMTSSWNHVGL